MPKYEVTNDRAPRPAARVVTHPDARTPDGATPNDEHIEHEMEHKVKRTTARPSAPVKLLRAAGLLAAIVASATACEATAQPSEPVGHQHANDAPLAGLETYDHLARDHVDGAVTYDTEPPVGGAHSGFAVQNCGFYSSHVQNEYAVHSLEHGAVWITYDAALPATDVDRLRDLAASSTHVLVSPYDDLPSPVVASAWGLQLRLNGADDDRLEPFVAQYAQGPQTPEPGAPCSGGAGDPG